MAQSSRSSNRVSVVIAAKDAEKTIGLCLRSALIGLRSDDEVLVFLDGCSDSTSNQVRSFSDSRIHVFESHTSIGRSAARNFLVQQASSDIISVLDADDFCLPWRFIISRRLLRKYDVVFGSSLLFGNVPFRLPLAISYPVRLTPMMSQRILANRNPFIHSTASYRKSVLEGQEPYEDVIAEEYLLWVKLAIRGARFFRSRLPFGGYRLHESQLSAMEDYAQKVDACERLNQEKSRLRHMVQGSKFRKTIGLRIEEDFLRSLRRLAQSLARSR